MSANEVTIHYHSARLLLTMDWTTGLQILLEEYSEQPSLTFKPMSAEERASVEQSVGPVSVIEPQIMVFENRSGIGGNVRREDLEARLVREGQK